MRRLSENAKTWLAVIPVAIAGVYVGRLAAELHNQKIEKAIEAIKCKSNSANTVFRDAAGSKDGI
ncbi:unnamed protein product [Camellia sinensis]